MDISYSAPDTFLCIRITERTGCPSVIFDGDQTDPRVFSDAQYETRIQALLEMMEKNKEAKRRGDVE